ncbi:DUF1254 domain-containing protein [Bradyrhizobium valentinum]|uniref:DUF1254 domain-containing protein n=1 Tax=Bradyrhizobium valentinum TaxID=1518501 RepID=UPI000710DE7B|nr:DUF1254 domain-containing protein [Bradyrhizobium valentinum]KRR00790.1 hypothetical protein CQ10_03235 [Bradyrhizobium valentinum]
MKRAVVALALLGLAGSAFAQTPQSDRLKHSRAVEAVIWGMPAVNFDRMLQAAVANGAKPNQVIYWSRPLNWQNQTLTPNPDTIYLNPFYDTRSGPVVLEIPPAEGDAVIVGSADNAWQNALEDVGPAGADKGKGSKYLITPPGYKGGPLDGYIHLPSDTYQGFVILRSNFKSRSDADIAAAVAYGKRIKIYPLGGSPEGTVYVDVYDKPFDATIPYDWRFFESLHRFVQVEPWLERDKVMIDLLQSIGIEKGKPFNPDAKTKTVFEQAAREARAEIDLRYAGLFVPPYFNGTHWAVPASASVVEGMGTGFADPNSYPVTGRAVSYAMGYFSAKRLGAGQFYLMSIQDRDGRQLDGQQTYRLTVPANAPVTQYWSATAYDRETHALIRETSRSSRASNSPDVRKNADGSVDIHFGPRAPAGKEANWVPTNGRDFEVLFRLYGPEKPLFEKTWVLPDIEKVSQQ